MAEVEAHNPMLFVGQGSRLSLLQSTGSFTGQDGNHPLALGLWPYCSFYLALHPDFQVAIYLVGPIYLNPTHYTA